MEQCTCIYVITGMYIYNLTLHVRQMDIHVHVDTIQRCVLILEIRRKSHNEDSVPHPVYT